MEHALLSGLVQELAALPDVEAIALGGSRAEGRGDSDSDFDVYVYARRLPPAEVRKALLEPYCSYMEIGNAYWETEDDCIFRDGICLDLLYRSLDDTLARMEQIWEHHQASCGYTTCLCHNVLRARVLYDEQGRYAQMQRRFSGPYPPALRHSIIQKNRSLLDGTLPAYKAQIEKAVKRGDRVSVQHRTTELLASYFDILFAFNSVCHPGEKRLLSLSRKLCAALPPDFETDVERLLACPYDESILPAVQQLIRHLDEMLAG